MPGGDRARHVLAEIQANSGTSTKNETIDPAMMIAA